MSIVFNDVQFQYDAEPILEGISLTLEAGHFVIIVGPNGAGKSTFMRLAAGLLKPLQGDILVNGTSCKKASSSGFVHYVPQIYNKNASKFPLTVEEAIALVLGVDQVSSKEKKRRVQEALVSVGMWEYRKRRIGALSGGQQQRVMIAQALAREAKILLLDEPTSGVDYQTGEKFLQLLQTLRDEKGLLIIMVTHDIVKALEYADQVLCLNRDVCYFGDVAGFMKTHFATSIAWAWGQK